MVVALAATVSVRAQLLKGYVSGDSIEDIQVAYAPTGSITGMQYTDVNLDKDNSFTWDGALGINHDVNVYVGNYIFGAHVEKGKTAIIRIAKDAKTGKYTATLDGDNKDASRYYNDYSHAFDMMRYFSQDPSEQKTAAEYRALLEKEYARMKKELKTVKDPTLRSYYTKLTDGMYQWTKIRIIMDQAYEAKKSLEQYPEYVSVIKGIDPNDPVNLATNLSFAWLGGQHPNNYGDTTHVTDNYLAEMDAVEKHITNKTVYDELVAYIPMTFFSYAQGADVNRFWTRYKQFARNYPQLIEAYQLKVNSITETVAGKPLPYDPLLTAPNGATCRLSSLKGKFTYIDIWATWCVPCCKEIPYLEKLVDHFKGNDRVQFVSISIDNNQQAWHKKLERDNPAWPQYIMSKEEGEKFMSAFGIGGIPRFIMLDKEGNIFDPDAKRPSDEGIADLIQSKI
jgi:thiol-disulfide isomerase/thioredoxin